MHRVLKPLAVVLVVPLLCTAIAVAARERVDERWQAGLRREFIVRRQPVNERLIARYSLASLCSDGRTAASIRPCRPYRLFSRLGTASFAIGVLGVLFLGAIGIAGEASRRGRTRRVRVFRLGLYATIAGLVVLVLLHGVLGIVGLYLLGEVIERWPVSFVFAGVVAALLAVLSMTQVALSFSRHATAPLVGRLLDGAAHPRLAAVLADVAAAVDAPPPERVVVGLVPQFFVTAGRFLTLDGRVRGRILYLSLPLARILSIDEFRALLGHELAHYSRAEEAASVYDNLHAGARRAVQTLREQGHGIRLLVNLPAVSVLSFFLESFAPAPAAGGASRELQADQVAARVAGAETLAAALAKVHAFAPAWAAVTDAMDRAVAEGTQYVNASELFARVVAANSVAERFVSIGAFSLAHPTDTLPPFSVRLSALAVEPPRVAAGALATTPAFPVAALIEDHEAVERDLSQVEQRLLAMGQAHLEG